jgi:hypothetical protein
MDDEAANMLAKPDMAQSRVRPVEPKQENE